MVNYKSRTCVLCGKEYAPTSPKQKYCLGCKEFGKKMVDRKRDRKRSRIKNNYKEYTRVCSICGNTFITHYSKKVYCGSVFCEKLRQKTNSTSAELKRSLKRKKIRADKRKLKKIEALKHIKVFIEKENYKFLDASGYINCHNGKILLQCPKGHEWETTFHNFKNCNNRCSICYQQNNYISKPELKIRELFENEFPEIEVLHNDRYQIRPKELDLYLPAHNLAIEVCGLYWHSDTANNVPRNYHYEKMAACKEKGIRLITIFEDELTTNFDLVKSRIIQAIGKVDKRLFGRKCVVAEVNSKEAKQFFIDNHIQGPSPAKKVFGLYYDEELVAAMSVGNVTRNHANLGKTLELKRFCSTKGLSVVGGASKLFKKVVSYANADSYDNIKSYCDMRYANIFKPVYELLGFELLSFTKYTPHYFKNGLRYRNMSLRKTPEERLTGKTELELRLSQGYNRIWDCGHRTYLYVLN